MALSKPSTEAMLVTAPSDTARCYEMSVTLPKVRPPARVALLPWLRITAHCDTGEVFIAAGMKAKPIPEDDGA